MLLEYFISLNQGSKLIWFQWGNSGYFRYLKKNLFLYLCDSKNWVESLCILFFFIFIALKIKLKNKIAFISQLTQISTLEPHLNFHVWERLFTISYYFLSFQQYSRVFKHQAAPYHGWRVPLQEVAFSSITRERLRENKVREKRGTDAMGGEREYVVRVHAFFYAYSRERTRRQGQAGCRQEFDFGCRPP